MILTCKYLENKYLKSKCTIYNCTYSSINYLLVHTCVAYTNSKPEFLKRNGIFGIIYSVTKVRICSEKRIFRWGFRRKPERKEYRSVLRVKSVPASAGIPNLVSNVIHQLNIFFMCIRGPKYKIGILPAYAIGEQLSNIIQVS